MAKPRKAAAMDLWSASGDQEEFNANLKAALESHSDYREDLSVQQKNGLRRRVKAELYKQLSPEAKKQWEDSAVEAVPEDVSQWVRFSSFFA